MPSIFTGSAAAPGAAAVIVDSGAMAPGRYECLVYETADDTAGAGKHIEWQRRNAANSATQDTWGAVPVPAGGTWRRFEVVLADGERIRAVSGPTAAAASTKYTAVLWMRPLGAS